MSQVISYRWGRAESSGLPRTATSPLDPQPWQMAIGKLIKAK